MILNTRALAVVAALSLAALSATTGCAAPTAEDEDSVQAEETNQDLVSRSAYFETFQSVDGHYRFNLVAGNGQNVLRSQGYTRLASAENGVSSILENGNDKRNFDVRQATNGDWYFNLKAANGQTIGTSELYASKSNAERGAVTVRALVRIINQAEDRAAPQAQQFEIFKGEDLKSYFRLRAGNGEIMLSSQGYTASSSAKKGIESVKTNGVDASRYQVFETDNGQYALRLVAANGEVIARGESYASKSNADRAVARLAEILSARTLRTAE